MKTLILFITLLPFFSHAADLVTQQEFQKMSLHQQTEVLKAYKIFVTDYSRETGELEEMTVQSRLLFIHEAHASVQYNCFYAGWPSVKKTLTVQGKTKSFCTSPSKGNTDYKSLAKVCGSGQMLCQPALFGSKSCVDVSSQAKRNSAFSQCQQKFMQSGRTLSDLAQSIKSGEAKVVADEMFALVHSVCSTGFQAKTGMCGNLKRRVAAIKESVSSPAKAVAGAVKPAQVQIVDQGKISEDEVLKQELVQTLDKVVENTDAVVVNKAITREVACVQCEQAKQAEKDQEVLAIYEASEAIDQSQSTPDNFCSAHEKGSGREKYHQSIHYDPVNDIGINIEYLEKVGDTENRKASGYDVTADHMGAGLPSIEEGEEDSQNVQYPTRAYTNSFLGRGKENSFEIVDSPVKEVFSAGRVVERYNSTDLRITQYAFFPRKVVPSIKHRDDKVIMKMTTGEEIVINTQTGKVISGAGKNVAARNRVEVRNGKKGKNTRTYPETDFVYTGDALYIESKLTGSVDQKEPGSIVSVKGIANGIPQECKVKSEEIWVTKTGFNIAAGEADHEKSRWSCTKFKFEKDQELYDLVKKKCPSFKFPALVK